MLHLREIAFGKSEYALNLRIETHRNDVWRTEGPPCDKHLRMPGNNFKDHAKFTMTEQVKKGSLCKSKIRNLLQHKENFWTLKLQALSLQGLDLFGNLIKTRFHTNLYFFFTFYFLSKLITWMSYAEFI